MNVEPPRLEENATAQPVPKKKGIALPFDPFRIVDALLCRWLRIVTIGLICGGVALGAALLRFRNEYQTSMHLIRQEPPNAFSASETGETFKPRTLAVQTVVSIMRSPTLLNRVAEATGLSAGQINGGLNLVPERNTDLIRMEFKTAASPALALRVLNRYAEGVVELTKKMQADEAANVNRFLKEQIARSDAELDAINNELLAFGREAKLLNADKEMDAYLRKQSELDLKYESTRIEHETIGLRIESTERELAKNNPGTSRLQLAKDELTAMLAKFTENNPLVHEQKSKIAVLEKQAADEPVDTASFPKAGDSGVADSLFLELVQLRATQRTLAEQVKQLDAVRARVTGQLDALPEKQMQYARIQSRKTSLENARVLLESRQREAALFAQNALGYYRILAPATDGDVATFSRTKKLIIFSIVGLIGGAGLVCLLAVRSRAFDGLVTTSLDLRRATGLDVIATLPAAMHRLTQREAWAFRTWTALRGKLGVAENGGVLGLLSREPGLVSGWLELFGDAACRRGRKTIVISRAPRAGILTLAVALDDPALILKMLDEWNPLTIEIEDGFEWDSARRSQWLEATDMWLSRAGAAVMIEITEPAEPESVLFCENLPELIVLASSGGGTEQDLSAMITPFREAGCNFSGAALDSAPTLKPAWLVAKLQPFFAVLALTAALASAASAAPPATAAKKPGWLSPYRVGPGDGFTIGVYGNKDLFRENVFVGADGRLAFLHASIPAAGLTVDGLRDVLNNEIGKFYQHSQVIVSPTTYASKRVFVLGKVVNKGPVLLDRPLTVLEAVAQAGGLETGLFQLNTVELADLPRALLIRRGGRVSCDFERLFNEGDMSQNHPLEPDDFLVFPSSNSNEFHLLGSVQNPGTQGLTPLASVVSAITTGGSFTKTAWRKRVLLVRGSLARPECIIVNVEDVLAGRAKDVRLQPHDIVYVSDSPWARAEEVLKTAMNAFTQAAVASWTGANVGPLIKDVILPQR